MRTIGALAVTFLVLLCASETSAFVSRRNDARIAQTRTAMSLMPLDVAVLDTNIQQQQYSQLFNMQSLQQQHQPSSALMDGIRSYAATSTSALDDATTSTTMMLSLKERPPPPTAEELAAKKRNFNFWFWGGGFVAPFLATFYYFGLKFWER